MTASKVPAVTAGFWALKIVATTLGETAGDAVTMSAGLGYLAGSAIFTVLLAAVVALQIRARRFHAALYWAVIIATTTAGTALADFCDRSLGIGYPGGVAILVTALAAILLAWRLALGRIETDDIVSPRAEAFYWAAIMASQTLGTALGDAAADSGGLGYPGGAALFGGAIAIVAVLYIFRAAPRTLLFWAAFILTRPLGATLGDFLDKPLHQGGLALDRTAASAVLVALIVAGIALLPQRAAGQVVTE